jgi:Uma2 family endonuclease
MSQDDFDKHIHEMPEPKLELIDGRLAVGNDAGNMQLLRHLLEGWGAEAALPMASVELWWKALYQGFQAFQPPNPQKPAQVWQSWASQLSYAVELEPAGPMLSGKHRATRQTLMMGLFDLGRKHRFAHVAGRDVIMRLGEDAFTPDIFVVGPERAKLLNEHYLDGPADLVIEVLLDGHEDYDRKRKRLRYGAGGVTDYWLVDPCTQAVQFLHWMGEAYRERTLDSDARYRPTTFPGLCFQPSLLWQRQDDWSWEPNPFVVESPMPRVRGGYAKGGVGWGDLAFDPQPGLAPRAISFEEFAAWAPEAKFEVIEGKPWLGGSRGSRNVLGLILRTEGLAKAVSVLHPRQWIAALVQAEDDRATDAVRRDHWWQIAREAAAILRERFGFGRLVVIGDLVRPQPLNLWSSITLLAFDLPDGFSTWEPSRVLYEKLRDEPDIDLLRYEHAMGAEQHTVATEGVDL